MTRDYVQMFKNWVKSVRVALSLSVNTTLSRNIQKTHLSCPTIACAIDTDQVLLRRREARR